MGVFEGKALYFVGVMGLVIFQSSGWLSLVKMYYCRWLSFSKHAVQFCGYASLKWDLVGCLGLNTQKNEKKTAPI